MPCTPRFCARHTPLADYGRLRDGNAPTATLLRYWNGSIGNRKPSRCGMVARNRHEELANPEMNFLQYDSSLILMTFVIIY